eukprot:2229027-Pyramimonas_sp.AAC.1
MRRLSSLSSGMTSSPGTVVVAHLAIRVARMASRRPRDSVPTVRGHDSGMLHEPSGRSTCTRRRRASG